MQLGTSSKSDCLRDLWGTYVEECASIQKHKNLWCHKRHNYSFWLHIKSYLSTTESPGSWSGLQTWASILSASLPAPTSSRKGPPALWLPGACHTRCWGHWANDARMRSNWYCPGRRETNPVSTTWINMAMDEDSKHMQTRIQTDFTRLYHFVGRWALLYLSSTNETCNS